MRPTLRSVLFVSFFAGCTVFGLNSSAQQANRIACGDDCHERILFEASSASSRALGASNAAQEATNAALAARNAANEAKTAADNAKAAADAAASAAAAGGADVFTMPVDSALQYRCEGTGIDEANAFYPVTTQYYGNNVPTGHCRSVRPKIGGGVPPNSTQPQTWACERFGGTTVGVWVQGTFIRMVACRA